ncbi:MAG: tetratricopeptide repeat protein [Phycisphaerae bacterium]|jgi:tetratricopeptide (TPR) repeat protein
MTKRSDKNNSRGSAKTLAHATPRASAMDQVMSGLLLLGLSIASFGPALAAGTVWDDAVLIFQNPFIHAADGLRTFWLTTKADDYFPLTSTLFWVEWRLWGADPIGYHVVNILLHAMVAVAVWRVLRRLAVPGAFLAAAIFAVHPVVTASAAWISEGKNTLCMLLFLLSLLAYLRFEDGRRRAWYLAALVCFLLALLAKTAVVTMPAVLLLLCWWRRGRVTAKDLLRATPFFVLSLTLGLATVWFQHKIQVDVFRPEGFLSRLAAAGWCIAFYLYKIVLPLRLSIIYPRWQVDASWPLAWLPLLALVVLAVVAWRNRAGWGRPVLAGLGYFVLMLLPVLGLVAMRFHLYSLVSDHLQYMAMIGPIALASGVAATIFRRRNLPDWLAVVAGGVLIAVLGGLSFQKSLSYRDDLRLWTDVLQTNPQAWAAHNNLGNVLSSQGQSGLAIEHYRQALKLKPDFAQAHNNLGIALKSQRQFGAAIEQYRQALRLRPDFPEACNNLGDALASTGQAAEAIEQYRQALRLKPDYPEAHYNLGNALNSTGRAAEAVEEYRKALELRPTYAEAHNNLGIILASQGQAAQAEEHYRQAIRVNPSFAEAHNNLGCVLADQGRLDEAIRQYERAVQLKPDYAAARDNLSQTLAQIKAEHPASMPVSSLPAQP